MANKRRALPGPFSGLSGKIIATIIAVILAVQLIIFLPSAAGFRTAWLEDRLQVGIVAARVLDAVPDVMALPRELTDRLLNSAGATAIVYRRESQSQLLELEQAPMPRVAVTADMRRRDPLTVLWGTLDTLLFGGDRTLRIIGDGDPGLDGETLVEVLMPEQPLRSELLAYSRDTFLVSLVVALMTALVLYLLVSRILIGPIRRLSASILDYRKAPENASLIVVPTARRDEIGVLESELAAMQTEIFTLLRQRRHLADLGLAVSKINHDLRNTLTSAQLLSDQVATLDDPKVQRLAPRLVNSIDRAVGFAQSVLDYGRQSATPPKPVPVDLHALVDEASFDAGLVAHPVVRLDNQVPDAVSLVVDPDQFERVLVNLMKNAREALELQEGRTTPPQVTVGLSRHAGDLVISVADNGPGLPPRARENLFVAFEGSARAGGTGLGLAIAREITEAHGGRLVFVDQPQGTRFDVHLPAATTSA